MPKTQEELEQLPYDERRAHEWCRCCKRSRKELGAHGSVLYCVGARWHAGLPPHMCGDCYGGDDSGAEARQMGISALD